MRFILNRKSLAARVLALAALTAQLAFATIGSIADAREPNSVQIHLHGPHQEHASHDLETCALCLALHSGGLPIASGTGPVVARVSGDVVHFDAHQIYFYAAPTLHAARAPPAFG